MHRTDEEIYEEQERRRMAALRARRRKQRKQQIIVRCICMAADRTSCKKNSRKSDRQQRCHSGSGEVCAGITGFCCGTVNAERVFQTADCVRRSERYCDTLYRKSGNNCRTEQELF